MEVTFPEVTFPPASFRPTKADLRADHSLYAAILAVAVIRAGVGWHLGFRPFDDTFITFRYSLNLSRGYGFVYNLNQPVLGTTTPLWTLVLAVLSALNLPLGNSALALSLLADLVTALLISTTLRRLAYSSAVAGSASLLFLCSFDYLSLTRSGMETAFFVLLTVATLHEIAACRLPSAGLFCGLACLTRPEGGILSLVLLLSLWQHRKTFPAPSAVLGLGLLLLCTAGWGLFAERTFGSVVPQSVVAKSFAVRTDPALAQLSRHNLALFFLEGQSGSEIFLRTYLQINSMWTLLSLWASLRLIAEYFRNRNIVRCDRIMILWLFPMCYVGSLALCHAFTWFPWYYGPIYPFYAAASAIGASQLLQDFSVCSRSRPVSRVSLAAIVSALALGQFLAAVLVKLPHDHSVWVTNYLQATEAIPHDSHTTVGAFEIGAVGWRVWPAAVLDVNGLVTPSAVGIPSDTFIRSTRPDYIVLKTDNAADFLTHVQTQAWFRQEYEMIALVNDPSGSRKFCTYHLNKTGQISRFSLPAHDQPGKNFLPSR